MRRVIATVIIRLRIKKIGFNQSCLCLVVSIMAIAHARPAVCQTESKSITDFYTHYTTNEGLSSNTCLSLLEDSRGFIWIGTAEGLNRFDGHRFRKYFHDPTNSNSICGNTVTCMEEDKSGMLWLGTYGSGITAFDPVGGTYRHYVMEAPSMAITRSNRIAQIVAFDDGKIFCGTEGGLFVKESADTTFKVADGNYLNLPDFEIRNTKILHDINRNGLWIYTADNLSFYDHTTGKAIGYSSSGSEMGGLNERDLVNIELDGLNRLWYVTNGDYAVHMFDPETKATQTYDLSSHQKEQSNKLHFSSLKNAILLSYWNEPALFMQVDNGRISREAFALEYPGAIGDARINDLLCNHLKLEWMATGHGLFVRRADQPARQLQWIGDEAVIIQDVCVLNGTIWLATSNGLFLRDRAGLPERRVAVGRISYIYYNKKRNSLLIGRGDGIYEIDITSLTERLYLSFSDAEKFSFEQDALQFIHEDDKGRMWIGTWFGNLVAIDQATNEVVFHASNRSKDIQWPRTGLLSVAEEEGELLIGFNGGDGVWRWNEEALKFEPYLSRSDHPKFNGVADAIFMDQSCVYIGTHGGGLCVWEKNKKAFRYMTRANGMVGDYVYRIQKLSDNELLVVTNAGICAMRTDNYHVRLINNDFTQETPLFSFSGTPGDAGEFWFWYRNYFYSLRDGSDWNPLRSPIVTDFLIFDQSIPLPQSNAIQLNYDQNFFTIEFSGFPFLNRARMEYAYKLEGINSDWVITRETNLAPYTNVEGGDYKFMVKARMDGSEWTEPTVVIISIKPPYWTTWWFRGLILIAVGILIYAIYRYRINQLVKMQAVRNRISSDLHDDVGASLSSINIYSKVALEKLKRSPEEVPEMLEQISRNATDMMDNMSDIVWSINPRNDTLESLVNRMKIHAIEALQPLDMDVRFVTGNLPENSLGMNARKNLYLVFKEIINNIAKHSKAKVARIEVSVKGDLLLLEISDNGVGISDSKGKGGNGLLSLKSRVTEMQGKLEIDSQPNQGTTLRIELSLARISDGQD